jgi:hypothetical protein
VHLAPAEGVWRCVFGGNIRIQLFLFFIWLQVCLFQFTVLTIRYVSFNLHFLPLAMTDSVMRYSFGILDMRFSLCLLQHALLRQALLTPVREVLG